MAPEFSAAPHLFLPVVIRFRDVGLAPSLEIEHVQPERPGTRLGRKVLRNQGVREVEVRPELLAERKTVGPPARFDPGVDLRGGDLHFAE